MEVGDRFVVDRLFLELRRREPPRASAALSSSAPCRRLELIHEPRTIFMAISTAFQPAWDD